MLSRIATVWQMAVILAAQTAALSAKPVYVGLNWVQKFVRHYDSLKSQFNHKYDYLRAKCEDSILLLALFKRVKDTKIQYRILNNNILNFDETGFQIGVITTARVVTESNRASLPRTVQPGN